MNEIFLIICLYFIAGSTIASVMNFESNDELGMAFIFLWPAFMVLIMVRIIVGIISRACKSIRNWFIIHF